MNIILFFIIVISTIMLFFLHYKNMPKRTPKKDDLPKKNKFASSRITNLTYSTKDQPQNRKHTYQ